MSIVRMRKVFRNRLKMKAGKKHYSLPSPAEFVFYLIIVIFVISAYYAFGAPNRSHGEQGKQAHNAGRETAVVATVNGEKITRQVFNAQLLAHMQNAPDMDLTQERYLKTGTLEGLIQSALLKQAADKEGIRVTGDDIGKKKDDEVERMLSVRFPDQRTKVRFLRKEKKTLEQYKKELRSQMTDDEALKEQIIQEKLQALMESRVTLSDQDLIASYDEVQASHILIDPKTEAEAAKKAATATSGAAQTPVDGDALAKKKADELEAKIKAGADFATLAKENSADPGSAAKGGDLGWFRHDQMVKVFADAAFALQPGQVSEPVKSDFGYHIIKVIARRSDLPKDFEKNKQMYHEQVLQQKKSMAWRDYAANLKQTATIQIQDPELQAYRLLDEGQQADGIALLDQAITQNPQNVGAEWQLANLYEMAKNLPKAQELVEKIAVDPEKGAVSPMVHFKLASLYEQQGQKPKAIDEYKNAFDRASSFTMMNFTINMQIQGKFKALGQPAEADKVAKWLTEFQAAQQTNPMGGLGGPMGQFQIPGQ